MEGEEGHICVPLVLDQLYGRIPALKNDARLTDAIAVKVSCHCSRETATELVQARRSTQVSPSFDPQGAIQDGTFVRLLYELLCTPQHTLAVASCLRPHMLRLVSSLVEGKLAGTIPAIANESLSLALLKILLLAPHTKIPAVKFFRHHPDICHHLQAAQLGEQQHGADADVDAAREELALYVLAALDAAPELLTVWRTAGFFHLLNHQVS
jgi:hypothetical protein